MEDGAGCAGNRTFFSCHACNLSIRQMEQKDYHEFEASQNHIGNPYVELMNR